jgi:predicted phosphodiesterase
MRVAALYDIHGNQPALEAVLADVREAGVDLVVVGGDVVPGPMVRDALTSLLSLDIPTRFIKGNGEVAALAEIAGSDPQVPAQYRDVVRWTASQLRPDMGQAVTAWPMTERLPVTGLGNVLFCHATPRNEDEIFTRLTSEKNLLPIFADVRESVVICGHTHMQFDRTVGRTRVVNAGSVGMPFGQPGAYWVLLGPDVEFRCTPYDYEEAAARIRTTSYPQLETLAVRFVLRPPSQEEMLAAFTPAEVKA